MELVLTGSTFTARDAEKWGLVARVIDHEAEGAHVKDAAVELASAIASKPACAVLAAKESVNAGQSCLLSRPHSSHRS